MNVRTGVGVAVLAWLVPCSVAFAQGGPKGTPIQMCSAPAPLPDRTGKPEGLALTVETSKVWKDRQTLRVRFLGGDPTVRAQVERFGRMWGKYANIRFEFGNDSGAEIRIAFDKGGSWSVIGTDALTVKKNEATMNFGWFTASTAEEEFRRTTLHEFGHALGFLHEHQNPKGGIPWDKPKVYEHYRQSQSPPWSKDQVDHNLFKAYDKTITNSTKFDPKSIMLYRIPNELTTGDFETPWNTHLSDLDKKHAAKMYPWVPGSVVGLRNTTKHDVHLRWKWSRDQEWERETLTPGEKHWWYRRPTKDGKFPTLEVRFDADPRTGQKLDTTIDMEPNHWKGSGYPSFEEGRKYRVEVAVAESAAGKTPSLRIVRE